MHCLCARPRLSQDHALDPKHSDRGSQDLSGQRVRAGRNRAAPQLRPKPDRRNLGVDALMLFSLRWASIATTIVLTAHPACAADIRVIISSGFHGAYSELA